MAVSSMYSQARTEFSFHPSINHDSKWRPRYDDHYNHKKMWKRMHDENEKIKIKNRLKSQQRENEELASCTFTPEIFTRRSKKDRDAQQKIKPQDVKQLSLRLYQYADLFKEKREQMKEKYDHERGEELRFTPKLIASSTSSKLLKTVKEIGHNNDISLLSVQKPGAIYKKRQKYYDNLGTHSARKSSSKSKTLKNKQKPFSATIYKERRTEVNNNPE